MPVAETLQSGNIFDHGNIVPCAKDHHQIEYSMTWDEIQSSIEVQKELNEKLSTSKEDLDKHLINLSEEFKDAKSSNANWNGFSAILGFVGTVCGVAAGVALLPTGVGTPIVIATIGSSGAPWIQGYVDNRDRYVSTDVVFDAAQLKEITIDKVTELTDNPSFRESLEKAASFKLEQIKWKYLKETLIGYIMEVTEKYDLKSKGPALAATEATFGVKQEAYLEVNNLN